MAFLQGFFPSCFLSSLSIFLSLFRRRRSAVVFDTFFSVLIPLEVFLWNFFPRIVFHRPSLPCSLWFSSVILFSSAISAILRVSVLLLGVFLIDYSANFLSSSISLRSSSNFCSSASLLYSASFCSSASLFSSAILRFETFSSWSFFLCRFSVLFVICRFFFFFLERFFSNVFFLQRFFSNVFSWTFFFLCVFSCAFIIN